AGAELAGGEIVVRIPGRRPMRRRLEPKSKPHLLTPGAAAEGCRVRLGACPGLAVGNRQVEPLAPPADRHGPRSSKGRLTDATNATTQRALGSGGRRGGRRRARGGATSQAEQGGEAAARRWADGEPGRDVRQKGIELGSI